MSVLGGRGGRQDDWSTQHARARARASERLDGPIDPAEERWLDEHLATCAECDVAATDYESQRLELRSLLDKPITPPRDLWARTAAAIELEARHRSLQTTSRPRRSVLAPYALLAGVLIVAVVVGRLSSSQLPGQVTTSPGASQEAFATDRPSAAPTPVLVPPKQVAYISVGTDGQYQLNNTRVNEVCPDSADSCATTNPDESRSIGPLPSPESVFGTATGPLVVVGGDDDTNGSRVLVIMVPDRSPAPGSTPSPLPTPSDTASATPTPAVEPTATPGVDSSPPPSVEPTATPSVEPTQAPGTVEIARDVDVVDNTAAYAPDGTAFAFTARPSDGSHGSDIYVWHIGEAHAVPITTDHRSVFGSWAGSTIVGSTVKTNADGSADVPVTFTYADSKTTNLPQSKAWRPVIDPTQGSAVYWTGSLKLAADGLGWETVNGRLVLGRWNVQGAPAASDAPTKSQGASHAPASEITIEAGPLLDWDARWDETGTRLAVWIANADDPSVGHLSLYVVDPRDGRIDASASPLVDEPALSGFSITDGRLAWAVPPDSSDPTSRVSILAWTADGFGQVETAPGDFILVR